MKHNVFETVLGFSVLIIAGFFLYMAYSVSSNNITDSYMLKAKFDKIDGISSGHDVKLAGVKVGMVKSVEVDPKSYQALVSLSVNKSINLPSDSSAEVLSDGLLGGKYINLSPGGSDEFLEDGDIIDLTQSSISLEQLIGKFLFSSTNDKKAS